MTVRRASNQQWGNDTLWRYVTTAEDCGLWVSTKNVSGIKQGTACRYRKCNVIKSYSTNIQSKTESYNLLFTPIIIEANFIST